MIVSTDDFSLLFLNSSYIHSAKERELLEELASLKSTPGNRPAHAKVQETSMLIC